MRQGELGMSSEGRETAWGHRGARRDSDCSGGGGNADARHREDLSHAGARRGKGRQRGWCSKHAVGSTVHRGQAVQAAAQCREGPTRAAPGRANRVWGNAELANRQHTRGRVGVKGEQVVRGCCSSRRGQALKLQQQQRGLCSEKEVGSAVHGKGRTAAERDVQQTLSI